MTAAARSATVAGSSTIALDDAEPGASPRPSETGAAAEATADAIYVHVLGAVTRPGLYTLAPDARVVDAIAAAGGLAGEADAGSINLARTLTDGEQIVVLRPGEAPTAPQSGAASPGGGAAATGSGPVNLNTATAEQLDTLPRIGPALAERIISWRTENGPFRLVDELLNVPGIGDATLAGLEGLVTV
ncbi:ComEA family DNA-binding protein [Labedella endophytica]|uniref:ComEA family DNA-binding protein n=1 Tax=Labedella endophytica TaxID=1523160 RepID=A0A3S0X3Y6_9MICO|nr:ComEA family DNA-binding protein [Labedella endophytica]